MGFINKITDTIVKDIIHEQTMNSGIIGSKLKVTGTNTFVILYKRVTLLQLKNWRKQFLAIITKQQINQDQVASSFVHFINTQLKVFCVCKKEFRRYNTLSYYFQSFCAFLLQNLPHLQVCRSDYCSHQQYSSYVKL